MPRKGFVKPSEYRREKRVHTLFTDAEFIQIQSLAEAAGLTVSAYLRSTALGQKPKPKPSRVASELVRELNRIGVNLNQFVRHAHAGRTPLESAVQNVLDELLLTLIKVSK